MSMDLSAAVEAAAIAWFEHDDGLPSWVEDADDWDKGFARSEVNTAVYAAAPVIEAQVREQIAREIEAKSESLAGGNAVARLVLPTVRVTLANAARIARGQK